MMLLYKLKLSKPFSSYVAHQITKMSYYTLAIGLISFIARQTAKNLQHHGFILKTGKAKAIRFTSLEAICNALDCQPGDILEYKEDEKKTTNH